MELFIEQKVDHENRPHFLGAFDFVSKTVTTNGMQYCYDSDGALKWDANKGLSKITYDKNRYPRRIQFSNGNVTEYVYTANGEKLKAVYRTAVPNIFVPLGSELSLSSSNTLSVDDITYSGNFIFENGLFSKYLFPEGYITFTSNQPVFHYYTRDHLGNNRAVVNHNGTVEQITHYYPFGAIYSDAGFNDATQHYKYNGKELDRMHGLNQYDYSARNYDPLLCRFTQIDPLCEKYYKINPYSYCLNNPIIFIDVKGKDPGDFFKTCNQAAIDFGKYYNPRSIRHNAEYSSFILYDPKRKMYYYLEAKAGESNRNRASFKIPKSHKSVATIHTHAAFDLNSFDDDIDWNDNFSGMQKTAEDNKRHILEKGFDDIHSANLRKKISYVVTPNGNLKKYDPKSGKITLVSKDMPSDKNANNHRANNNIVEEENLWQIIVNSIMSILK